MPKLKSQVVRTHPERIDEAVEYAVLYIQSNDNFDAIDCANEWAMDHKMERARELTLGRARIDGRDLYVARCYRRAPDER